MTLTPANTAQPRTCGLCGTPRAQVIHMRTVPSSNRHWRRICFNMVTLRGTTMRVWRCGQCGLFEDAGTTWPPPDDPARPEIVSAIRRLKAAGHRFFEWEKK